MVISDICCNFMVSNQKLTNKHRMITDDKITEIFFMADNFCQFYDELVKNILFRLVLRVNITEIVPSPSLRLWLSSFSFICQASVV